MHDDLLDAAASNRTPAISAARPRAHHDTTIGLVVLGTLEQASTLGVLDERQFLVAVGQIIPREWNLPESIVSLGQDAALVRVNQQCPVLVARVWTL